MHNYIIYSNFLRKLVYTPFFNFLQIRGVAYFMVCVLPPKIRMVIYYNDPSYFIGPIYISTDFENEYIITKINHRSQHRQL